MGTMKRKRKEAVVAKDERVLTLGDGDFSFSLALQRSGVRRLHATSFDAAEDLACKYCEAEANIELLRGSGATVTHGVDATRIRETLQEELPFDRIIFNFPHTGLRSV